MLMTDETWTDLGLSQTLAQGAGDYPMVAPNYAAARSELAKQMGLGARRRKRPEPEPAQPPAPARGRRKKAP